MHRNTHTQRMIDVLDLQLFLAVIVIFISTWMYLNSRICNFTESTSTHLQMSYILVHYILSIFLFLCIYISFIKGKYIIVRDKDITDNKLKYFILFLDSWFITLLLGFLILISAELVSWWIWAFILLVILGIKLKTLKFERFKRLIMLIYTVICFPLYISIITSVMREVEVVTDKPYYNLEDNIMITVNVKGYACKHRLVGLGEKELFKHSKYQMAKNMIILPASVVKTNSISVGIESPVSGKMFFIYPILRILEKDYSIYWNTQSEDKRNTFYSTTYINIKP